MYCTTCGKEIPDDSKFCIHCGATVHRAGCPNENEGAASQQAPIAPESSISQEGSLSDQDSAESKLAGMSPAAKIGAAVIVVGLAAGIAFGSYSVYTNFVAPVPQQQSSTASTASEDQNNSQSASSSAQQTSTNLAANCSTKKTYNYIEAPKDPYKSPGQKSKDKWTYDQLTSSNKSDASDKINSLIKDAEESTAKKTSNFPTSPEALKSIDSSDSTCTVGRDISVTYLKGNTVGVYDSRLLSDWKSQDRPVLLGAAYDLSTGKAIDPASVYNLSTGDVVSATKSAVKTYLSKHPSDTKTVDQACSSIESNIKGSATSGLQDNLEGSSPLVLTDSGLVYMTSIYELGSWNYGCHGIIVASDSKSLVGTEVDLSTIHKID